ncbi:MAG: AAA family ATPase [Bacteroidetes bacterium]|nr:AAA family ATPase [Bacteroidota bacterium]
MGTSSTLSVTVENVRCFGPAQTLDLSGGNDRPAQWTVILGDNGTGKTTLLQAIAALEPINVDKTKNRRHLVHPRWFHSSFPKMKGVYRLTQEPSKLRLNSSIYCGSKLTDKAQGWVVDDFEVEEWSHGNLASATPQSLKDIGALKCYAYGASRHMAAARLKKDEEDDPTASLFSDDVLLPDAEEWLLQADYAASRAVEAEKERAEKRRDQIIDMLKDLLPDVEDVRFALSDNDASPLPRVKFETPYGCVTIEQLSLGYRTMIAWTVDLARRLFGRYPASDNPLAEPAVVLVDEIDLHLHPKWQRDIIRFLSERFPNTQFIVTAHSPLVVQAAADANIVLLRREGDHVVIENDLQAIRNWRIDQILTSDLFGLESARPPYLDKLLKQRREILSKGTFTEADRKELEKLEAQIGELPTGETPEDIKAMDVIRRAAAWLETNPDAVYDSD